MWKGAHLSLQESWDFLQLQCALYINSEMSGIPLAMMVSVLCLCVCVCVFVCVYFLHWPEDLMTITLFLMVV